MGSCREMCRRAFRGLLVIPGCKTVCYKCILPPCYSNNESDDEKDDKDDEGYDSCGQAASDTIADGADVPLRAQTTSAPDYVNQIDYTNLPQADQACHSKSCENLYVTMQLDSVDHLNVSRLEASGRGKTANVAHASKEVGGDYVNTKKMVQCTSQYNERTKGKPTVYSKQQNVKLPNKMNEGNNSNGNQTSSKSSSCGDLPDTVRLVVSGCDRESSNNQQTLVLLETDL